MFQTRVTFLPSVIWNKAIGQFFKKYLSNSFDCLDHFAINLISPNGTAITLCSNEQYLVNYKQLEIDKIEIALSPWIFENFSVIPWRLLLSENDLPRLQNLINFKEAKHHLHSGMTFINKLDDYYLTVAVASNNNAPDHTLTFLKSMDEILNMGAYFYDYFKGQLEALHETALPAISQIALNDQHFCCAEIFARQWMDTRRFVLSPNN